MTEQGPRGHWVEVSGPISRGQITVGDNNVVVNAEGGPAVDIRALTDFAQAVRQALPTLELGRQQDAARQLIEQLLEAADEPAPDAGRLRILGQSLRAILESGVGGVLSSALLSIWSP